MRGAALGKSEALAAQNNASPQHATLGVDVEVDLESFSPSPPPFSDFEVFPGPEAWSEEETRSLRDILLAVRPHGYLSLHSGAYTLMESPAWTENAHEADKEIRAAVHSSHHGETATGEHETLDLDPMRYARAAVRSMRGALGVDLPRGPAGTTLHYVSPGTSLDWAVLEGGVLVSVAAEVYAGDEEVELARWEKSHREASMLQFNARETATRARSNRARNSGTGQVQPEGSSTSSTSDTASTRPGTGSSGESIPAEESLRFDSGAPEMGFEDAVRCFTFFNPSTIAGRDMVVARWVKAINAFAGTVVAAEHEENGEWNRVEA